MIAIWSRLVPHHACVLASSWTKTILAGVARFGPIALHSRIRRCDSCFAIFDTIMCFRYALSQLIPDKHSHHRVELSIAFSRTSRAMVNTGRPRVRSSYQSRIPFGEARAILSILGRKPSPNQSSPMKSHTRLMPWSCAILLPLRSHCAKRLVSADA